MDTRKEREHNAMVIKGMRKLLDRSEAEKEPEDGSAWHGIVYSLMVMLVLSLLLIGGCFLSKPAHAEVIKGISVERLADSIRIAEGVKSKHPYGILKRYKVTTPRQACINTIKSALKRWTGRGDFIVFLGKTYCPVGALNDPTGLNRHWVKNVKYYYKRGA